MTFLGGISGAGDSESAPPFDRVNLRDPTTRGMRNKKLGSLLMLSSSLEMKSYNCNTFT